MHDRLIRALCPAGMAVIIVLLWNLSAPAAVQVNDEGLTPAAMALRFYQKYVSDLRHGNCRFDPSCSQYALEVTEERGFLLGSALAADRLIRCNGGAHRYHSKTPDGRLIDPAGGACAPKAHPEVPSWLMPVYDRPPPFTETAAGDVPTAVDSTISDSAGVDITRPRMYLEDCAGFAEALAGMGDCERAATEYLRVAYLGQAPELRFWARMRIGNCLYSNEDWEAATAEFREAAGLGSTSGEHGIARFMAAGSSFNALDYGLCGDLLSRFDASERRSDAACMDAADKEGTITREHWLFLTGLGLMGTGDWEGAAGRFEEVLTACPRSSNLDRAVFLASQAEIGPDLSHRSPTAAAVFSAVIPGSGQMYSGRFSDGLRHLVFDGLLIYTVYWLAREENYTGAYLVAGITLPFYVGNIMGAKRSAEWFNSTKRNEFIRDSINATR